MDREGTLAQLNRRLTASGEQQVDLRVYRTRSGRYGVEVLSHRNFQAPILVEEIWFSSFREARGWAAGYVAAALAAAEGR